MAERVGPSRGQIVERHAGRAEEHGIDLIKIAAYPLEKLREGNSVVAGRCRGDLRPDLSDQVVIGADPERDRPAIEYRIVGFSDGLNRVFVDGRQRGGTDSTDDLLQGKLQLMQLMEASFQASGHDLKRSGQARGRSRQEVNILGPDVAFLSYIGEHVLGREFSGFQNTHDLRGGFGMADISKQLLPGSRRPHRSGTHGKVLTHADLPARVLASQAGGYGMIGANLNRWAAVQGAGVNGHTGQVR